MPIYAIKEARDFWKTRHARSLAASAFVMIAADEQDSSWRKTSCESICEGDSLPAQIARFHAFTEQLVELGAETIEGKLEARLIINAGNGVMENGGISLDRVSGQPFIPGSAVKGCARRTAIGQLSEENDLEKKAKLLAEIAIVFGYGDQEWKSGRKENKSGATGIVISDFWLAMVPLFDAGSEHDEEREQRWTQVAEKAAAIIFQHLGRTPKEPEKPLVPQLPNLSGVVAFLPAFPTKSPVIETDVLTPHHKEYYEGNKNTATDDENPTPILFPTIGKGTPFRFTISPLLSHSASALKAAIDWLKTGIELHGIGAKTNAGYGWFSLDEEAADKASERRFVSKLRKQHAGFDQWELEAKEEAILSLSEKPGECLAWHRVDATSFAPVLAFAESNGIQLL